MCTACVRRRRGPWSLSPRPAEPEGGPADLETATTWPYLQELAGCHVVILTGSAAQHDRSRAYGTPSTVLITSMSFVETACPRSGGSLGIDSTASPIGMLVSIGAHGAVP